MVRLAWVVVVSGFWQLNNFTRIYRTYSVPCRVMADSRTVEPPSTVQKVYSGAYFEFGVDGYVSLGSRYGWVLTINQLYPYLPFIFISRARNGRFKKVFSCFVFNFFIEVLKTHVVLDYLNPAYQAAARPASFTRVFRAYYLGQSYLTVGFLFDRSAIRCLAGWTKMDLSQADPKEISFPYLDEIFGLGLKLL